MASSTPRGSLLGSWQSADVGVMGLESKHSIAASMEVLRSPEARFELCDE